jgi:colicin import membrane protein
MRTNRLWLALAVVAWSSACGAPEPATPADARGESAGFCQRKRAQLLDEGLSHGDVEKKIADCERLQAKQAQKLKAEADAKKKAAEAKKKQDAADQADADQEERFQSAKRAAAEARATRLREWQTASAEKCGAAMAAIGCDDAAVGTSDEAIAACRASCAAAVEKALATTFGAASNACVEKYAAAAGNGSFSCAVSLPATADLQGDALKARIATCSKDCATRGAEAVALARKLRLEKEQAEIDRLKAEAAEKKAAEFRAKERARAATTAPGLVTGFHKCMIDVDATPEARDLRGRDCTAYKAHMQKSREQCRTKYTCAWVEEYSNLSCEYAMLACYVQGETKP